MRGFALTILGNSSGAQEKQFISFTRIISSALACDTWCTRERSSCALQELRYLFGLVCRDPREGVIKLLIDLCVRRVRHVRNNDREQQVQQESGKDFVQVEDTA